MTPEAQRIAIAEACGWKYHGDATYGGNKTYGWHLHSDAWAPRYISAGPPNYLSDLNAMHEAEKGMTESEHKRFRDDLWLIVAAQNKLDLCSTAGITHNNRLRVSATAAQRAEAFLRTLNLWTS